jgi:anti-sigma-K factor RskA
MTMNCNDVQALAAELALGVVTEPARAKALAHVDSCPVCRHEVERYGDVHEKLLELTPSVEPPLGFDGRVLEEIRASRPARRRWTSWFAAAAAAIVLVVVCSIAIAHDLEHARQPTLAEADFKQGDTSVGDVYFHDGSEPWLFMSVDSMKTSGTVHCQIKSADGKTYRVGSFPIVNGNGYWGAPSPAGITRPESAELLDSDGNVVAQAKF